MSAVPTQAPTALVGLKKKDSGIDKAAKEAAKGRLQKIKQEVVPKLNDDLTSIVGAPVEVLIRWESFKDSPSVVDTLNLFLRKIAPLFTELCQNDVIKDTVQRNINKVFIASSKEEKQVDVFYADAVKPTLKGGVLAFQYNLRGGRYPSAIPMEDVAALIDAARREDASSEHRGVYELTEINKLEKDAFPAASKAISESLGAEVEIVADWSSFAAIAPPSVAVVNVVPDIEMAGLVPVYRAIAACTDSLPNAIAILAADVGMRSELNKHVARIEFTANTTVGLSCSAGVLYISRPWLDTDAYNTTIQPSEITALFVDANEDTPSPALQWLEGFALVLLMLIHVLLAIVVGYCGYVGGGIAYVMTAAMFIAVAIPILGIVGLFGRIGKFMLWYLFALAVVALLTISGGILSLVFFSSEDYYLQNCKEYESAAACEGDNADRRRFFAMMGGFTSLLAFAVYIIEIVVGFLYRRSVLTAEEAKKGK